MKGWSILALALWVILMGYSALVIAEHGLGLLPIFFGDMAELGWPGQFNLDFMLMLFVSASWTMWRNRFSMAGVCLGVAAFFLGASFLLPYLAYLIAKHRGNMSDVLIGPDFKQDRNP